MSTIKQFREKDTEKEIDLSSSGLAGKTIGGRYKLVHILGQGAMGSVHSAIDTSSGLKVAVKIIDPRDMHHQVAQRRFQLEADAARRIDHPNILRVIDTGECPEHGRFIVMELLDGISLLRWMDNTEVPEKKAPYLDRLVSFCIEICDGLQAAHDRGVVHRDVKPSNVFLYGREIGEEEIISPKILDFGVAKVMDLAQSKLTKTGELCGTSEYIAPELILGEKPTAQSDVYSMGILLYYGLTGTTPFRHEYEDVIITRAVTEECEVPKPGAINPAVPERLERICLKAVERDKESRYRSAMELGLDLRRFRESPEDDAVDADSSGTIKIVAAVFVGVVILGIAVGIALKTDLLGDATGTEAAEAAIEKTLPEPTEAEQETPKKSPAALPVEDRAAKKTKGERPFGVNASRGGAPTSPRRDRHRRKNERTSRREAERRSNRVAGAS